LIDDHSDSCEDAWRNRLPVKLGDPVTSIGPSQSGALLQANFRVAFAVTGFGADQLAWPGHERRKGEAT